MLFIIEFTSPSPLFAGASSHSVSCLVGRRRGRDIEGVPRGVDATFSETPVADDFAPGALGKRGPRVIAGELLVCFAACRRNPKTLSPLISAAIPRIERLASVMPTSPPVPTNAVMKKADVMTVGTVTVPENVVARAILWRTNARYALSPTTLVTAEAR